MHVAIIMDGNGRWATRRGLSRVAGHRAGAGAVRRVVEGALDCSVDRLTLYAFSADNWLRPASEVQSIFWLLRAFLRLETERLRQRGVCLKIIGRRDRLARPVLREIERAEKATKTGGHLELRVAIDYSSRDAIARAAANAIDQVSTTKRISNDALGIALTQSLNESCGTVDFLIRTGGEKRLSDFLLWESAYAELFFIDRMWPDFTEADLRSALDEFRRRERRFGAIPSGTPVSLSQVTSNMQYSVALNHNIDTPLLRG